MEEEQMKVLEPINIGSMRLKNRFVLSPMLTNYATVEGYVTERVRDYYAARADGGSALLITEAMDIEACGRFGGRQIMIDDDTRIAGLSELANTVHKHGAKIAAQLNHAGRSTSSAITGCKPVAPSAIQYPGDEMAGASRVWETPRQLTVAEVKEVILRYTEAAQRLKKAGFDALELHCAHGNLINQFLSPNSNKREDEYGGDVKNRARFLLEIIASVKKAVGDSFPIICRINGDEPRHEGGASIQDAQEIAKLLEAAGVAAIDVTEWAGPDPAHLPMVAKKKGYLLPLSEAIKQVVKIPVIAVGRLDAEVGEQAIKDGKADLIAMGRCLLADPQIPNKMASGKLDQVTPCIVCNTCHFNLISVDDSLRCRVNPMAGREREYALTKTKKAKKIVVIGGGPAGLEAATIAARRGHKVILFEKEKMLGGQLITAAVPPYKDILLKLIDSLSNQARAAGINIKLGKEPSVQEIRAEAPDEIILASGVLPNIPEIKGANSSNVVTAEDLLAGKVKAGQNVIILGGELVACETAEMLVDAGKSVTVTRRGAVMLKGVSSMNRASLLGRLARKGVIMLTNVVYSSITNEGLVIVDKSGRMQTLPADTIVLATGNKPNTGLVDLLGDKAGKVHKIGDCLQPRSLLEAISEGYNIGRTI
jgi:2,4-dienoyl-CoA reductase-like NADH-dependent reductase (Old Yellow Enzyme family)/thioredoxin reductase